MANTANEVSTTATTEPVVCRFNPWDKRQNIIDQSMDYVATQFARRSEQLHLKIIPQLKISKLDDNSGHRYQSQSARENYVQSRNGSKPFEDIDEMDRIFEAMTVDQSVDSIIRRSRRDGLSKEVIVVLDKAEFKKSVEAKSLSSFAEYEELYRKASRLNDHGGILLDLSRLKLGDRHAASVAEGFSKLTAELSSIRHISLRDNRLTDDGIIRFLTGITNKGIQYLDISENNLKKRGAEVLGRFILSSPGIERLFLGNCGINSTTLNVFSEAYILGDGIDPSSPGDMSSSALYGKRTEDTVSPPLNMAVAVAAIPPAVKAAMLQSSSLISLCLPSNKICDRGAIFLAAGLKMTNLTELDLSWNEIMNKGACAIISELNNCKLVSLDLSWNSIGSKSDVSRSTAHCLSKMFETNTVLTHLDISQNHFDGNDCSIISKGLHKNHTLLGLHLNGNGGSLDAYGYLLPDNDPMPLEAAHCMTRIIGTKVEGQEQWFQRNNCWICGMWRETKFTYKSTKSDVNIVKKMSEITKYYGPLYLGHVHIEILTSFDKWKRDSMKIAIPKNANPETFKIDPKIIFGGNSTGDDNTLDSLPEYELHRCVPPGTHYYVFSISGGPLQYDPTKKFVTKAHMLLSGSVSLPLGPNGQPDASILPEFVNILITNVLSEEELALGAAIHFRRKASPRSKNDAFKKLKIWSHTDSIVDREVRKHDHNHLHSCHMHDWFCLRSVKKLQKVRDKHSSDVQVLLEAHVRKYYSLLKDCYVEYACKYSSELFFMGTGAYNEFITQCNMMDKFVPVEKPQAVEGRDTGRSGRSLVTRKSSQLSMSQVVRLVQEKIANPLLVDPAQSTVTASEIVAPDASPVVPDAIKPSMITLSRRAKLRKSALLACGEANASSITNSATSTIVQNLTKSDEKITPAQNIVNVSQQQAPGEKKKASTFEGLTRTEVDMIFISMCLSGPKHELNTKRSLCRFQFIDSLIAMADVKFVKTKKCPNVAVAFERLCLEHIIPFADRHDAMQFRSNFLLTEEVDDVLRENVSSLSKIYKRFSGAENTPKEAKAMSPGEWMSLCDLAGLSTTYPSITERAKELAFCRSKAVCFDQFEEIFNFKKMTMCEFLEGVVRLSHQALKRDDDDDMRQIDVDRVAEMISKIIDLMKATLTQKKKMKPVAGQEKGPKPGAARETRRGTVSIVSVGENNEGDKMQQGSKSKNRRATLV